MTDVMTMNSFCELNDSEMMAVDGGSWQKVAAGFAGCVLIANAPVIGIAAGIGGSVVGTPVAGVCAGIAAASATTAAGAACLDYYTK